MADACLGAFAVFFVQSPSFLAYQRDMQRAKGQNNAQSLFEIEQVATDAHIRNLLDPVGPEHLAARFWQIYTELREGGYLQAYQGHLGPWLCALDGTHGRCSSPSCSHASNSILIYRRPPANACAVADP
jgi:hypothetical protein